MSTTADQLIYDYSKLTEAERAKFDKRYADLGIFRLRMRRALKHAAGKQQGLRPRERKVA